MPAPTIHRTYFKPLPWLLLALAVTAVATPRAAHAHSGHRGQALIFGAALGYALHDAYGRDRAYFVHDTHRHRGWRGCRARSHFRLAPGYRHLERAYYRGYYDDRRARRAVRKARRNRHVGHGH